jgi:replicative DNA helicase
VESKAIDFARTQALNRAAGETAELTSLGRFDEVKGKFDAAFAVGTNSDPGIKYEDELVDRLKSYDEVEPSIPTGLSRIDEAFEGGLHRKEMGLYIGPPGGGKTAGLINFGKHALIAGYNVVHFSMELRRKRVARRYDMSIAEMTKRELIENKRSAIRRILSNIRGKLTIQHYAASSVNCNTFRAYLTRLRNDGVRIGLIIVDYDDLVNPTKDYGESIGDVKRLYKEFRSLPFEFDCGLWTASQTNKKIFEMQDGEVIGGREMTGSLEGKFGTPDVVISGNQTYEEYKSGVIRMHLAKNREGEGRITEPYRVDYTRMLIKEV